MAHVSANRCSIAAGGDVTIGQGARVVLGDYHQHDHRCTRCGGQLPGSGPARAHRLLCSLVCMMAGVLASSVLELVPRDILATAMMSGMWGYLFLGPGLAWADERVRRRARASCADSGL
ncbi:MAG: hypothetical protein AB1832_01120 [Pseudomonadota bacterium]